MNSKNAWTVVIPALVATFAAHGQIIIDNFNAGNFSDTGAGNTLTQTQTGPSDDIVGGVRFVRIEHAGSAYTMGVTGGQFNVAVGAGATTLQLGWGNLPPLETGSNLGLDLSGMVANGGFSVNVTEASLAGSARFKFLVASALTLRSESPEVEITGPGNYFFPFAQFTQSPALSTGPADFSNINAIVFSAPSQIVDIGSSASLTFGGITASPVPEPEEWAMLGSLGLLGFAAWRRRTA